MIRTLGTLLATTLACTWLGSEVDARTWIIKPDGTGDAPTIQAGVDLASPGDTVLVECGVYYEHDVELRPGICLRSVTGEAGCATIDAQHAGRVLQCSAVGPSTTIEGFELTGGVADEGAGIYIESLPPRITRCALNRNAASAYGGGLYADQVGVLLLTGCTFEENSATSAGGAIYCRDGSPSLLDCSFEGNTAGQYGGALFFLAPGSSSIETCEFAGNVAGQIGGAAHFWATDPFIEGCLFQSNSTETNGSYGALYFYAAEAVLLDCEFIDNHATANGAIGFGESSFELSRCTFAGNAATSSAYGFSSSLWSNFSSGTIADCTFAENRSSGCAIECHGNGGLTIERTIIAFSTQGVSVRTYHPVELSCCDIYGNAGGDWIESIAVQLGLNGNISADPMFCHPDNRDFTLDSASPCAPANSGGCGVIGAFPVGCGATPVERTTWGAVKASFRQLD